MRKLFSIFVLLGVFAGLAIPQATMTSTTLSVALDATATNLTVASATGITAASGSQVNTVLFVDKEALTVQEVSGTVITVRRNYYGLAGSHASGATVWVGPPSYFGTNDKSGSCTSALQVVLPYINVNNGNIYRCTNSAWDLEQTITKLKGSLGNNLDLQTVSDSKPVRINSRDYTQTSGSSIGFQVKPNQTTVNANYVMGGEISPRIATGIAGAGIIGLHVDAYLKGTTAGTISGDVRSLNVEVIADDAGTRTISGNVSAIRIRSAFSATTITGKFVPIRIEYPETQTNSKTYDAVFELTGTVPLVWNSAPGTEPTTADGYIKVLVNGAARYIQLYSTAPTD